MEPASVAPSPFSFSPAGQGWNIAAAVRAAVLVLAPLHVIVRFLDDLHPISTPVVLLVCFGIAARIVQRDAMPIPKRQVVAKRESLNILTVMGLLFGGGALWMLCGLLVDLSNRTLGFGSLFTVVCLLLFIAVGLLWRPSFEIDFEANRIVQYRLSRALPWIRIRERTLTTRVTTPKRTRRGGLTPWLVVADLPATQALAVDNIYLDSFSPETAEEVVQRRAEEWETLLLGPGRP